MSINALSVAQTIAFEKPQPSGSVLDAWFTPHRILAAHFLEIAHTDTFSADVLPWAFSLQLFSKNGF